MRSVWISRFGGPEVLEVRESQDPQAEKGEARIDVRAAGLNFAEIMARQGMYPDAPKAPCVVGYEVCGVIDQVGQGVTSVKEGDRVIALCRFGGHASKVVIPASQAIAVPATMPFDVGAAIPVAYLTAFHMLFQVAHLRPGMTVLVHMAAGGVGIAALQLCRTVEDVTVIGTASSGKHEIIREEGCDHPIDYRSEDYSKKVREITDGRGVDIVLDALGGRDWKRGYKLLAPAGHLVAFGFANMAAGETRKIGNMIKQIIGVPLFTPMGLMDHNRTISGVNMGHMWSETDMLIGAMRHLVQLWDERKIKPRIDSTFSFEQAADAHRRIHDRKNIGKVILVP